VKAVGVGREQAVEAALGDGRDVLLGERRVQAFLAGAPYVAAGVALPVVEDPEVEARVVENARERLRNRLVAGIE
jgi:hypothetical protein